MLTLVPLKNERYKVNDYLAWLMAVVKKQPSCLSSETVDKVGYEWETFINCLLLRQLSADDRN